MAPAGGSSQVDSWVAML